MDVGARSYTATVPHKCNRKRAVTQDVRALRRSKIERLFDQLYCSVYDSVALSTTLLAKNPDA